VPTSKPPQKLVLDREGKVFGTLDFRAPEHVEVILAGNHVVRVSRSHFVGRAQGAELRLTVKADEVFLGKQVTTIDGIDLGPVVEVVRDSGGRIEALICRAGGEATPVAVPPAFLREVTAHIILEPSDEEVMAAQGRAAASKAVRAAIARARAERGGEPANVK